MNKVIPSILLLMATIGSSHAFTITEAIVEDIPFYAPAPNGHFYGEFTVNNDTSNDIFAFAVATHDPILAFTDTSPFSQTSLGWTSVALTADEWNSSTLDGSDFWLVQPDNARKLTTDFGSFEALFGTEYSGAFLYAYQNGLSSSTITAGSTQSGFYFETTSLGSPYMAFSLDDNNNPLALITGESVHVSSVPLPAAAWLFISGLISIGVISRRKSIS